MSTALDTASATPLESVMFQNWERVTFLHWRIRREEIQARLPRGLTVDTFDGEAWLGLTPFELTGLRPPFLPALPWISRFLETNLRTYVRGPDGAPGIWFFSLDASRLAAVIGARIGYGLPYHWARMRVRMREKEMGYFSRRYFGRGAAQVVIRRGDPIIAAEREIFLTARFRLYATIAGRLAHADVEHRPWPLENAHVIRIEQNLTDAHDLRINGEPLVHFSPGVETRIGRPRWSSVPRHTLTS